MDPTTKSLTRVRVKDEDQGIVEAVFASRLVKSVDEADLDDIDKDGDVTLKGAFPDGAEVVISAYGHQSWKGALPVGKGVIREEGDEAIVTAEFFLDTTHGRDTFNTVKGLGELQEWSYSLHDVKAERSTVKGRRVRVLKKIGLVKEVSPTLRGAGIDTRTLATKSADETKQLVSMVGRMLADAGAARWEGPPDWRYCYLDDFDLDEGTAVFCLVDYVDGTRSRTYVQVSFTRTDTSVTLGDEETEVEFTTLYIPKSTRFSEHKDIALRGVTSLVEMAKERLALRAPEGKSIDEQRQACDELAALVTDLKSAVGDATQSPVVDELRRIQLQDIARAQGVLTR